MNEDSRSRSRTPREGSRASAAGQAKPKKPYADFPLFPHATRRWAKKIRGKFVFFGPWEDPHGALERFLAQKDDLLSGRVSRPQPVARVTQPRRAGPRGVGVSVSGTADLSIQGPGKVPKSSSGSEGVTVRDLVNHFLTAKQRRMESGEMGRRSFADYYATAGRLVKSLRGTTTVEELQPQDFGRLRVALASTRGPVSLGNEIGRVRSIFKFGFEAGLIDRPVRYGPEFVKPSKRAMRQAKNARGERMFEAGEIRRLLAGAGVQLRAMILLGINCGMGNTDVAALTNDAVDLKAGRIDFPRLKTGVPRRAVLWEETVAVLKQAAQVRPKPKRAEDAGLWFVTKYGWPWVRVEVPKESARTGRQAVVKDAVVLEFGKLMRETRTHEVGRGFYGLRHSFRTVADEVGDRRAIDLIMGHENGQDIATHYVERISDERLAKVVGHVREWLWTKKPSTKP